MHECAWQITPNSSSVVLPSAPIPLSDVLLLSTKTTTSLQFVAYWTITKKSLGIWCRACGDTRVILDHVTPPLSWLGQVFDPPPFHLLPPGLSMLLLGWIYAALPSASWIFCCSVLWCCSALQDSIPPPPRHPPVSAVSVSSAPKFILCHV